LGHAQERVLVLGPKRALRPEGNAYWEDTPAPIARRTAIPI
jgi:hypothetical protein